MSRRGSGTTPQHREHRRGVGGRGDRAEQHRELPAAAPARSAPATAITAIDDHDADRGQRAPRAASTGRTSRQLVVSPPSARMIASAAKPERVRELGVLEVDADPGLAEHHAHQQVDQQAGQPAPATDSRTARIARSVTAEPTSRNWSSWSTSKVTDHLVHGQGRRKRSLSGRATVAGVSTPPPPACSRVKSPALAPSPAPTRAAACRWRAARTSRRSTSWTCWPPPPRRAAHATATW